jgi:hypothetical protein
MPSFAIMPVTWSFAPTSMHHICLSHNQEAIQVATSSSVTSQSIPPKRPSANQNSMAQQLTPHATFFAVSWPLPLRLKFLAYSSMARIPFHFTLSMDSSICNCQCPYKPGNLGHGYALLLDLRQRPSRPIHCLLVPRNRQPLRNYHTKHHLASHLGQMGSTFVLPITQLTLSQAKSRILLGCVNSCIATTQKPDQKVTNKLL